MESNKFFLTLSFFLTVMLFIYVKMDQVKVIPIDFKVRVEAPGDIRVLPKDSVVRVYIKDKVRNILPLIFSQRYISVPVKSQNVGIVKIYMGEAVKKSIEHPYVSIEPESLVVFVERYKSAKREVRLNIKGKPPEGYVLEDIVVRPELVDIRAPESMLNGILSVGTEDIDVSSVKGVDTFRVALSVENPMVEIRPDSVEVIVKTRRIEDEDNSSSTGGREGK